MAQSPSVPGFPPGRGGRLSVKSGSPHSIQQALVPRFKSLALQGYYSTDGRNAHRFLRRFLLQIQSVHPQVHDFPLLVLPACKGEVLKEKPIPVRARHASPSSTVEHNLALKPLACLALLSVGTQPSPQAAGIPLCISRRLML